MFAVCSFYRHGLPISQPSILASSAWRKGGALFITWDEGFGAAGCCTYTAGGHVATLVISPLGKPHYRSAIPYDHYSLLATIAALWHLKAPGYAAMASARPMAEFFTLRPGHV